jgi:hypothetical protein
MEILNWRRANKLDLWGVLGVGFLAVGTLIGLQATQGSFPLAFYWAAPIIIVGALFLWLQRRRVRLAVADLAGATVEFVPSSLNLGEPFTCVLQFNPKKPSRIRRWTVSVACLQPVGGRARNSYRNVLEWSQTSDDPVTMRPGVPTSLTASLVIPNEAYSLDKEAPGEKRLMLVISITTDLVAASLMGGWLDLKLHDDSANPSVVN